MEGYGMLLLNSLRDVVARPSLGKRDSVYCPGRSWENIACFLNSLRDVVARPSLGKRDSV